MKVQKLNFSHLKKLNAHGETYKNKELKNLTTFKVGGNAKYFLKICTLENFLQVMDYLESINIKYFILGAGSNLLVSDLGFDGVVIKFDGDFKQSYILDENTIEFGCAVNLVFAYVTAKNLSLSGLEDSTGIPATIGGATFMNAQAYNFEMAKIVDYVVAYVNGKITYFTNEECKFQYRNSIFHSNKAIILRVGLKFERKPKEEIEKRFLEVAGFRKDRQPLEYPSAGCVFRRFENGIVSKMLDDAGFKGLTEGGAKVSEKHANFIINYNNATASDIFRLINRLKKEFKKIYDIELSCELRFLGEFDETIG